MMLLHGGFFFYKKNKLNEGILGISQLLYRAPFQFANTPNTTKILQNIPEKTLPTLILILSQNWELN